MNLFYRWLPPIILFVVAGYVWNFNNTHADSALLFPLLDLIPALEGDVEAQADASWKVFVGVGVFVTFMSLWDQIRHGGKKSAGEETDEA